MDTQIVELIGRSHLIEELLRANLEVAQPLRDRGIDLIAYVDLESMTSAFKGCPIQLKASQNQGFSLNKKYSKFPNLILAYVWHLELEKETISFGLTYKETYEVAEKMDWLETDSWKTGGYYSTSKPSVKLRELLEPYQMNPQKWWDKVTSALAQF